MYALLSSSSTGHRTSSPLSSQIQDEMPYIHCTCATQHGPFQPQLTSAASAETRASALFRHVRRASDAFRRAASMHHRLRHDRSADTHHDLCPHHHRCGPFYSHLHDGINGRAQRTLARSATCGKTAVASALDWTIYRLMHPGQWGPPPPQSTPGSRSLHSPDAPVRWVRLREEVTTGKPPRRGLPFPDQGDHRGRSGKNSIAAFLPASPAIPRPSLQILRIRKVGNEVVNNGRSVAPQLHGVRRAECYPIPAMEIRKEEENRNQTNGGSSPATC
ncbi:hypothetical protein CKAH01_02074 [Colletotrichum kahawae]|uniref:Uncharacterized protein n=1 Tax=Colletotrichum kahawae TaxID=34407 RepID=A0AAD9Y0F3_COLKA|nr:hypothetical protein CKAH01_02074 [Colletotrichum kahawae]